MGTYEIAYRYEKGDSIEELQFEGDNILCAIGNFIDDNGTSDSIISVTLVE
tara:strand:- start:92 stop:244 length:153 start_codon:yes stop_codon:yes gene_type:complete